MNKFSAPPVKREGEPVYPEYKNEPPKVQTTYVERRVPVHLEEEVERLIDAFLASHGYDPEEI